MRRHILSLSHEQRTAFALDALVSHANALNQPHRETCTTPFPKAPSRWLSHAHFTSRPLAWTTEGDVEGGLGWRIGATIDVRFTRSLCAPHDGARGGPCYDPASRVVLEVRAQGEQDADDARFCHDRHPHDTGRRSRERAGLHGVIPGEDDLRHCRDRVGAEALDATLAVFGDLFRTFGLIQGALVSTDGQLASSHARDQGCPDACQACQAFRMDEVSRLDRCGQRHSGAKRLQLPCPFPEVVDKGRQATGTQGTPKDPTGALLEMAVVKPHQASGQDRQPVATRLGLTEDEGPALRLPWCPLRQSPQGALVGCGPKGPADREATVGYHIETKDPTKTERGFGYGPLTTTDIHREWGLEWPLGHATSPANADAGTHCLAPRTSLALPVGPGHVPLGDAGDAVVATSPGMRDQGGGPASPTPRATTNSTRSRCASAAMIRTARPRPPAGGCAAPMATLPKPTRDSMAVACLAHPRHSSPVPSAPASWATATAGRSETIRASLGRSHVAPRLGTASMPRAPPVRAPTATTRKASPTVDRHD